MCGYAALPPLDRACFAAHAMDQANWAELRKPNAKPPPPTSSSSNSTSSSGSVPVVSSSNLALVPPSQARALAAGAKPRFVAPVPGVNGAQAPHAMSGKTVVLTGTFPELGGGCGLDLGKARCAV